MYRYFTGLQVNQVAELLGVDRKTVQRDWEAARAFLLVSMEDEPGRAVADPSFPILPSGEIVAPLGISRL